MAVFSSLIAMGIREMHLYRGGLATVCTGFGGLARNGWAIVVTTEDPGPTRRIRTVLSGAEVPATLVDNILSVPQPGMVVITTTQARSSFVAPELGFAILSESDLMG